MAIENSHNNRRLQIKKWLETVFLIAICSQSSKKWQSKTVFLTIFFYVIDSLNILDCCLSDVDSIHVSWYAQA